MISYSSSMVCDYAGTVCYAQPRAEEISKMKKFWCIFWGILVMTGIVAVSAVMVHRSGGGSCVFAVRSCISEQTAVNMARAARLEETGEEVSDTDNMGMQIVYQLAKRSIVKVTAKDAAGSGIIWKIDDGIVIVSNRHLLMNDVVAEIGFGNGDSVTADVIGYSQQYDIGFAAIPQELVTDNILRDIYEVVPIFYETESEGAKAAFASGYAARRVLQAGAATDRKTACFSVGSVIGLKYMPLFNTSVLETACFSRAGMSGGGVFDAGGHFLGLISGGEVPEDAQVREAEITYSIPPALIAAEYETVSSRIEQ